MSYTPDGTASLLVPVASTSRAEGCNLSTPARGGRPAVAGFRFVDAGFAEAGTIWRGGPDAAVAALR
ncbi:hypothetical protein [Dactylosporangium sp. NPDC048998]|uniref:hypothetical protein n=1 Tax=Dactylosporangium sp. NPDC048998 TaxID=3363976 RepID=UPI0037223090